MNFFHIYSQKELRIMLYSYTVSYAGEQTWACAELPQVVNNYTLQILICI